MSWEPRGKADVLMREVNVWPQLFTLPPPSPVSDLAFSEPGLPLCVTAPWAEGSGTRVRYPLGMTHILPTQI